MYISEKNKNENQLLLAVFAIAAILFASISGWQTYLGYKSLLGGITSIGFAVVTSLLMFFLNLALRKNRITFKPTKGIFILLLTIISVSFLGNFNAIYSKYAEKDLTTKSIANAWNIFDANMKKAETVLATKPEYMRLQKKINTIQAERNNLIAQVKDPNNPGMGDEAKKHLRNIQEMLSTKITVLKPPTSGADIDKFSDYAAKMGEMIDQIIEDELVGEEKYYSDLIRNIGDKRKNFRDSIQARSGISEASIVGDMKRVSNEVFNDLKSLNINVDFINIETRTHELGEINKTLHSAFIERPEPIITLVVLFISLLIDFLIPLITLVYYQPGEEESYYQSSNDVGIGTL